MHGFIVICNRSIRLSRAIKFGACLRYFNFLYTIASKINISIIHFLSKSFSHHSKQMKHQNHDTYRYKYTYTLTHGADY